MLTLGSYTRKFEKAFAEQSRVKYAVAVNSATAALEMTVQTLSDFDFDHDEVLVPTNTFPATVAAVIHAGLTPKLTDVNPETLCIGLSDIEQNMTEKTKMVIAVHIGGLVCPEIEEIRRFCSENGLYLIEDAAHAHGSTLHGQKAGSFGIAGCFSFYATKVMTTGEGGMITTNSFRLMEQACIIRDQGKADFHSSKIIRLGSNWRLPEINAAIGIVQLRRLPEIIRKRNQVANCYDNAFEGLVGFVPRTTPSGVQTSYTVNNFYKYVVLLNDCPLSRDEAKARLKARGVHCSGEVYDPPVHLQPFYRQYFGAKQGDFPNAEMAAKKMLCLPIHTSMTLDDARHVAKIVKEILT